MAHTSIKSLLLATLVLSCSLRVSGETRESDAEAHHLQETPRYNIPLSGTTRLDSLSSSVANVWSVVGSGLIAAVLVTAGVYVFGLSETIVGTSKVSRRVSKQSAGYYDGQYSYGGHYGGQHQYGGHEDRWGRRQEGVSHQLAKIMAALSVDSVQDIVSGVKHGILGRLSSVRDNSLKRVDEVQSSITNSIDTGFEALGGGSKLEDCFLQAVCYLTPDEEEGEARKLNKDKQRRREEKRRQKQNKKKNKNKKKKVEVEEYDDDYYEDYEEDYEDEEEVTESTDKNADEDDDYDTNEDGKVTSDDCHVFKCDLVKHGYTAFQLYNKVQNLRTQISSLREEAEAE